jgi:DNA-binding Lrp family transcriptional regulator
MKETELRLISELMKNSRRSDRELARAIGISQPTVSRLRTSLEKTGTIREYTMIPDFIKLGYELMALTFISVNPNLSPQEAKEARARAQEFMKGKGPSNIIMLERGIGLEHTGAIISFHTSYSDYRQFIQEFKQAPTKETYVYENIESFLIDLKDEMHYRSLTLRVLADHILKMNKQKE